MREYVLSAEYDRGADPVMDIFIDNPDLIGRALRVSVSNTGLWRVDRFVGSSETLNRLEAVVTDTTICNECLGSIQTVATRPSTR
ncbi:hypothetical protein ACODNH_02330 (plasmid) [Haloarcula sp. NS06]|uniref:hypothetical protein n=1 Tax=Haloarcula sp. NS06 TaxID=3409688 RepID=UPI003DA6FBD2